MHIRLKLFAINLLTASFIIVCPHSIASGGSEEQLKKAIDMFDSKQFDQSIELMKPLIEGPEMANPEAHFYYARALWKTDDLKGALKHFKRSLEIYPYGWRAGSIKKDIAEIEMEIKEPGSRTAGRTIGGLLGYTGLRLKGSRITHVFDNSPAQKAHLRKGDEIVSIDGYKVNESNLKEIDKKIRGPVGSMVMLGIKRDGKLYGCKLLRAHVEHEHNGISFPEKKFTKLKAQPASSDSNQSDKSPQKRNDDLRFIEIVSNTANTEKIQSRVLSGLSLIPDDIKNSAYKSGLRVVITPTILHAFPDFSNLKPRGYIHGGRYDNCGGLYSDRKIYIAEKAAMYNHPYQLNAFVKHTLLHEFGHAYDNLYGVSSKSFFRKVYKQDKDRISNTDLPKYQYFLQSGDAGPSELFAELFAHIFGSNKGIEIYLAHFEKSFPRTTEYVRSLLKSSTE